MEFCSETAALCEYLRGDWDTVAQPAIGRSGLPCGLALPLETISTIQLGVINHADPLWVGFNEKYMERNETYSVDANTNKQLKHMHIHR